MSGFFEKYLWWLPFGKVPEVTVKELKRELARTGKKPAILDVRTPAEYARGHIKGALNIPMSMLRRKTNVLQFTADEPLVAMCHSARRSIVGVRLLQMRGYQNVRHLKGGIIAWKRAGMPVTND
jgi:rhodanese-related sulfurtransferase